MIIEGLLKVVSFILNFVFDLLPDLPEMPSSIVSAIDNVLDVIFGNVGLFGIFVPLNIVKILIPLWLVVYNFDKIYSLLFWVIKKIPILNIRE